MTEPGTASAADVARLLSSATGERYQLVGRLAGGETGAHDKGVPSVTVPFVGFTAVMTTLACAPPLTVNAAGVAVHRSTEVDSTGGVATGGVATGGGAGEVAGGAGGGVAFETGGDTATGVVFGTAGGFGCAGWAGTDFGLADTLL